MQGYLVFVTVIVLLLISWSLVTFWQRWLENLIYGTFGLNPDNTMGSFLTAVLTTGIFLGLVWLIKISGIIPNIDNMIYDYQDDSSIGGPLDKIKKDGRMYKNKTIGSKISPRGALLQIID